MFTPITYTTAAAAAVYIGVSSTYVLKKFRLRIIIKGGNWGKFPNVGRRFLPGKFRLVKSFKKKQSQNDKKQHVGKQIPILDYGLTYFQVHTTIITKDNEPH